MAILCGVERYFLGNIQGKYRRLFKIKLKIDQDLEGGKQYQVVLWERATCILHWSLYYLSFCLFPQTIYMFCALALICDDYFVPSLEKICEVGILSIKQYAFAN